MCGVSVRARVSGPPVVRTTSAAGSTDAFSGTASLRERLARSLITTTATSTAGKKKNLVKKDQRHFDFAYIHPGTSFD